MSNTCSPPSLMPRTVPQDAGRGQWPGSGVRPDECHPGAGTVGPTRHTVRVTEPTLTTGELNRAVLARQLLLDRADLTPAQAVARVAGLQTQYAPSGYVGLWSRLRGFRREQLTAALEAGEVVQGWAMRCTIHMVARADYPPFTEAVREVRRQW